MFQFGKNGKKRMKEIQLTQGKIAIVDDEKFEELSQFDWCVEEHTHTCYARRAIYGSGKKVFMHHQIIGKPSKGFVTDHIDSNGLHNWETNLRFVTNRVNCHYKNINMTSFYPGVSWNKRSRKWEVHFYINGKNKYLGRFEDELEAAQVYREAFERTETKEQRKGW